jgi:hypothetical protein
MSAHRTAYTGSALLRMLARAEAAAPVAEVPVCAWFAACVRPAVYRVAHPVLGEVPTCAECVCRLGMHDRATPLS